MVALTPAQQRAHVREHPRVVTPVTGTWGEQGATSLPLDAADDETLGAAMTVAWRNAVEKGQKANVKGQKTVAGRKATAQVKGKESRSKV